MAINNLKILIFINWYINLAMFSKAYAVCVLKLDERAKKNPPMILDRNGDMIYPTKSRELKFGKNSLTVSTTVYV